MKHIVLSVMNGFMSEAISAALIETGNFTPYRLLFNRECSIADNCKYFGADICLMEVSYAAETTLEKRLKECREVREKLPECKIVFLCDENSAPDIARGVTQAKKDCLIDNFLYSSVTGKYLTAVLESI